MDAWYWFELCQAHCSAKPVGLTTSHANGPLHSYFFQMVAVDCSSARATSLQKQFCLASVWTSREQSNPGLARGLWTWMAQVKEQGAVPAPGPEAQGVVALMAWAHLRRQCCEDSPGIGVCAISVAISCMICKMVSVGVVLLINSCVIRVSNGCAIIAGPGVVHGWPQSGLPGP